MEPQRQEYRGHRIELRAREVEPEELTDDDAHAREAERELAIDDRPVAYGRLPDGSYFLDEYAYDWHDDLMDLARRLVDHRQRADKIRRQPMRSDEG